jgi:hypothetical protein
MTTATCAVSLTELVQVVCTLAHGGGLARLDEVRARLGGTRAEQDALVHEARRQRLLTAVGLERTTGLRDAESLLAASIREWGQVLGYLAPVLKG